VPLSHGGTKLQHPHTDHHNREISEIKMRRPNQLPISCLRKIPSQWHLEFVVIASIYTPRGAVGVETIMSEPVANS